MKTEKQSAAVAVLVLTIFVLSISGVVYSTEIKKASQVALHEIVIEKAYYDGKKDRRNRLPKNEEYSNRTSVLLSYIRGYEINR